MNRLCMTRRFGFHHLLAALALLSIAACSADAVEVPEPTRDTKGAFLAVGADEGGYQLFRILAVLGSGQADDALFVVPYAVRPQSFEEARELAKDPSLQGLQMIAIGRGYVTSREWRVVWFRSVSSEEEADFR
jgi:hypothetical protein